MNKDFSCGPRYELKKPLGSGAYGVVFAAIDTKTKEKVAIKKLNKLEDIVDAKRILREIRILRSLKNENILELINICYDDTNDEFLFINSIKFPFFII